MHFLSAHIYLSRQIVSYLERSVAGLASIAEVYQSRIEEQTELFYPLQDAGRFSQDLWYALRNKQETSLLQQKLLRETQRMEQHLILLRACENFLGLKEVLPEIYRFQKWRSMIFEEHPYTNEANGLLDDLSAKRAELTELQECIQSSGNEVASIDIHQTLKARLRCLEVEEERVARAAEDLGVRISRRGDLSPEVYLAELP